MRKSLLCISIAILIINSYAFSREKTSETQTEISYSYTDWEEFYSVLLTSAKKDLYQYAYLYSIPIDEIEQDEHNSSTNSKPNNWTLISRKKLSKGIMMEMYAIVSPNEHRTCLVLTNTLSFKDAVYRISTKNNSRPEDFLYEIEHAFDDQLCFFDEEVPLKLQDFYPIEKQTKNIIKKSVDNIYNSDD